MATRSVHSTTRPATLFLLSAVWIVLALAGGKSAAGFAPAAWRDAVREAGSAALLFAGFYPLAWCWIADLRPLSSVGFVRRPGFAREFGVGAALGWGIALALLLPAALTRSLSYTFDVSSSAVLRMLLSALTLTGFAFVVQLVIAGLPARLLLRASGPGWTTAAVLLVATCLAATRIAGEGGSVLFTVLEAALFISAFLRTRAIWLPLGMQIGWTLSMQLLFGIPSPYVPAPSGVVQSNVDGPEWLTGGVRGMESSLFAVPVVLVGLFVLARVTREYAWNYTYQPIAGAGYAVEVPPPVEHANEERRAAQAVPLVQIQGISSTRPPADPLS